MGDAKPKTSGRVNQLATDSTPPAVTKELNEHKKLIEQLSKKVDDLLRQLATRDTDQRSVRESLPPRYSSQASSNNNQYNNRFARRQPPNTTQEATVLHRNSYKKHLECFDCGLKGHFRRECPNKPITATMEVAKAPHPTPTKDSMESPAEN